MARFSFGGAQDLSGIFADLYRLGDAQADREQAARDDNVINQWETGEISDEEFYAFAQRRIEESADDPEALSQWQQILRNAQQQNEGEAIEDSADDILDRIESGQAGWDELLAFYQGQLRKLRPSDPLYNEVQGKINEVESRIRDNQVASTYGSIDYRFRSGQISASQAGKEVRALAEQFRQSDPQKYYELLGQALDLEQGVYNQQGGRSRSGGGSGGGSGSDSGLKDTINQLEGFESRLLALSKQARDGQRVGQITVPNSDGTLSTETFTLLNANGTVTSDLRALHHQTLELYDELEAAHIADGNLDAAGEDAERRSTFITDYVQPTNTIAPQRQFDALVDSFVKLVQNADPTSPALSWREIQRGAERIGQWYSRINTRTTSTDRRKRAPDAEVRENPELAAAVRKTTTSEETDITRRVTPEFTDEIGAQVAAIMQAVQSDDPAAIMSAFEGIEGGPLADIAPALAQLQITRRGLNDGSFQLVMTPNGIRPLEVVRETTGLDENGDPRTRIVGFADASGQTVFQTAEGEDVTTVLARIGSDYVPVMAPAQQQQVALSTFTWDGVTYRRGQAIPDDVRKDMEDAVEKNLAGPQPVGQMHAIAMPDGQTWYGLDKGDGTIGWFKNRVPRNMNIPSAPAPYTGPAENAQAAFERLGLDPTGRAILDNAVATGNRVSMRAFDRFAGPNANIQRATADVGFEQPSPSRVIDPDRRLGSGSVHIPSPVPGYGPGTTKPTLTMAQTLAAVRGDTDPIGNIRSIGQSLGIRGLGERQERLGAGRAALRRIAPIDAPDIRRPNIRPVNVRRPNVDVAGLRSMAARLRRIAATRRSFSLETNAKLQSARNKASGGFV